MTYKNSITLTILGAQLLGAEVNSGCFLQVLATLFFEILSLKLIDLNRLTWPMSSKSLTISITAAHRTAGVTSVHHSSWLLRDNYRSELGSFCLDTKYFTDWAISLGSSTCAVLSYAPKQYPLLPGSVMLQHNMDASAPFTLRIPYNLSPCYRISFLQCPWVWCLVQLSPSFSIPVFTGETHWNTPPPLAAQPWHHILNLQSSCKLSTADGSSFGLPDINN